MTDPHPDTSPDSSGDSEKGDANRRPIRARGNPMIARLATRLVNAGISPNQISQASVGFAALALLLFWAASVSGPIGQVLLLILAAGLIQMRLLCNLLDGLVAVEGGQASPEGAFWNEAPDRAADLLFFWGAGLFAGSAALGLGCGALALITAWMREFGRAEGFRPDFSGPMAKPHRMAALTAAALAAAFLPLSYSGPAIMMLALWLIAAGIGVTIGRRGLRLLDQLAARG